MRIALAQIVSTGDPQRNLDRVLEGIARAAGERADLVVFPEATQCAFGHDLAAVAEPLDGPWASAVAAAAARHGITVVAGMFTPGVEGRVRNTLLLAGPDGVTSYDKIHLFDAFGYAESETVEGGDEPVVLTVAGAVLGFATCYDIRFPALFTATALRGATIGVVCASWGAGPGKAEQWELLARARAIDSTSFVVAVGQGDPRTGGDRRAGGDLRAGAEERESASAGAAPTGIGHSLVVSPLGSVLHRLGAEPAMLVVELDPEEAVAVRRTLPVLANRRAGLLPE
ncbi:MULTISPECIES: carbon-nitrogen hydrolase family protein [unclassified Rathayibacter]|uniref:carbon-nitrogen hydrolase family protein n=1 Tax=unclassified Rathayibacter TaxID=2609250 RepID=UPI00188B2570|nr:MULTISPECIES: carbon-nitrogen hydrolase family protein [unclassified Rathayibacter]MBF4463098.1 carbon-nitrogen hydrolase family protein [Rathayibacter sp. VKM Ac-2879]MBF4504665.1 carbon-nitrogen hydrolase family protein [Rathayibacter sp. VKM Ac-2878]